jgi:hypothetical protein
MKKDSLENIALRVLTESKMKSWNQLDSATQKKLTTIYAMHSLGNLQAEGQLLRDAIAEIYQLGLSQQTR